MSNFSLEHEIDKVARQLAGVEAQLQTALDTLITTSSVPPILETDTAHNRAVIAEPGTQQSPDQIAQISAQNRDEDIHQSQIDPFKNKSNQEYVGTMINEVDIKDRDLKQEDEEEVSREEKYDNRWQTIISTTKDEIAVSQWPCQRRAPASNVTIIRITASKPQLSTTQCSSLVRIGGPLGQDRDSYIDYEEDKDSNIEGGETDKEPRSGYSVSTDCSVNISTHMTSSVGDTYTVITPDTLPDKPTGNNSGTRQRTGNLENNNNNNNNNRSHDSNNNNNKSSGHLANQGVQSSRTKLVKRSQSVVSSHRDQAEVFQLKQHCRSLEGELDGVKSEIIRILSEKDGVLRENGILKELQLENQTLKEENRKLRERFERMLEINLPTQSPNSSQDDIELELPDRSSPDGEELETGCSESISQELKNDKEANKEEQIKILEESLEMMKLEFDKMEKYWSNKLANERKLYEDHIQQNDTKIHDWELGKQCDGN